MREARRCLAWALALGTPALAFALFAGAGLAQLEGPVAWMLFAVYAPYYGLVHALGDRPDAPFWVGVFVAQTAWFLALVALARRAARGKARWRPRRRAE